LSGPHPSFIKDTPDGFVYEVYGTDSETMKDIKVFMAQFGVYDITMRMLKVPELLRIMGFGDQYILIGNQGEQKKYIGNAVCPEIPAAWCKALTSAFKCEKCRKQTGAFVRCSHKVWYPGGTYGCDRHGEIL
jgi:hypothetical protein